MVFFNSDSSFSFHPTTIQVGSGLLGAGAVIHNNQLQAHNAALRRVSYENSFRAGNTHPLHFAREQILHNRMKPEQVTESFKHLWPSLPRHVQRQYPEYNFSANGGRLYCEQNVFQRLVSEGEVVIKFDKPPVRLAGKKRSLGSITHSTMSDFFSQEEQLGSEVSQTWDTLGEELSGNVLQEQKTIGNYRLTARNAGPVYTVGQAPPRPPIVLKGPYTLDRFLGSPLGFLLAMAGGTIFIAYFLSMVSKIVGGDRSSEKRSQESHILEILDAYKESKLSLNQAAILLMYLGMPKAMAFGFLQDKTPDENLFQKDSPVLPGEPSLEKG